MPMVLRTHSNTHSLTHTHTNTLTHSRAQGQQTFLMDPMNVMRNHKVLITTHNKYIFFNLYHLDSHHHDHCIPTPYPPPKSHIYHRYLLFFSFFFFAPYTLIGGTVYDAKPSDLIHACDLLFVYALCYTLLPTKDSTDDSSIDKTEASLE